MAGDALRWSWEATGVYWKAPWAILEDEFECMLVNARHVKQATLAIGQEQASSPETYRAPALAEREQQALRRATRLLTSGECGRLRPTAPGARPSSTAGVW